MTETTNAQFNSPFACPRCGNSVQERFFGPCSDCREQLGSALKIAARDVDVAAYVPKMNVVPNQVATKE